VVVRWFALLLLLGAPLAAQEIPAHCRVHHIKVTPKRLGQQCGTWGTIAFRATYYTKERKIIKPSQCPADTVFPPSWGLNATYWTLSPSGFILAIHDVFDGEIVVAEASTVQGDNIVQELVTFKY
jgi:hypothetical protein